MDRFILCTRDDDGQEFIAEPGPTRYLQVPAGQLPEPRHTIKPELWFKRLRKASVDDVQQPPAHSDLMSHFHLLLCLQAG